MNSIQLINDDYKGHVDILRHACRGILVHGGKILLVHESKENKYIIPGGGVENGETLEQCCEREMLEETGMKVRVGQNYLEIEELFDVWKHINHYFVCELIEDTGKVNLTEGEKKAGCVYEWRSLDEALEIFGKYEQYRKTDIPVYGLYKREYTALEEFKNQVVLR